MVEFILEHIIELLFGILAIFTTAIAHNSIKEKKEYKKLLEEKENADTKAMIQQEIRPVVEELHRLEKQIQDVQAQEKSDVECLTAKVEEDIGLILASYKFRLIQLCTAFLKQGYMTTAQFEQLSEFYKVYHGLNGNGQAQEYYERAIKLPIHD